MQESGSHNGRSNPPEDCHCRGKSSNFKHFLTAQPYQCVQASSKIAAPTVTHLLDRNPNVQLTILSRAVSRAVFPSDPRIIVKKGDYDDEEFLLEAFRGQDAVMIVISIFAMEAQYKLIDAAAKVSGMIS